MSLGSSFRRACALAMVAAVWAGPALAEEGTFSFVLENDLFYDLDRDYTNGIQFGWTSGPKTDGCFVCDAARVIPVFEGTGELRVNYALGQAMYTPSDITLANPPLTDRPYAGWLYGSIGVIAKTDEHEGWSRLEQLQLSLGVVGPSSLAEEAQKLVHEITGASDPKGWDTQLGDEPAVLLTYERSWRYRVDEDLPFDLNLHLTPHVGAAVGNVFTYANAGGTISIGWNIADDYGPPRVQPSTPGSGYFQQCEGFGIYAFAGVDGRAIAQNIFLDGNTWRDSRSVEKEPFVVDAQVGLAMTFESARLSFTHVFRSREFETQGDPDEFGAVELSVQF